ncbi:PH domain-containing protein [Candidatus Woesebacteria bacterium]|nr:PH domain-containing protein [Candidatus Woesebacteria bacterium]
MSNKKVGTTSAERSTPKRHVDEYSETMRNEVSCDNHGGTYVPKPNKLSIDIQAEDEQIILLLRQHLLTQLNWVFIALLLSLAPILFSAANIFDFLPMSYRIGGVLGWYLLVIGFSLESYLKWFYRVFVITDERIIDVDITSMIHKDISTTKLDKIEDISAVSSGFLSSIFDYGTVVIQTAGTEQVVEFEDVPHPAKVSTLLNEMLLEEELEKFEGRVK